MYNTIVMSLVVDINYLKRHIQIESCQSWHTLFHVFSLRLMANFLVSLMSSSPIFSISLLDSISLSVIFCNVGECFLLGRFALNLILLSCNLLYLPNFTFFSCEFLLLKINLEGTQSGLSLKGDGLLDTKCDCIHLAPICHIKLP